MNLWTGNEWHWCAVCRRRGIGAAAARNTGRRCRRFRQFCQPLRGAACSRVHVLSRGGALTLQAELLQRLGGVVTIVMGLAFMGMIPALQNERRFHPRRWSTWVGAPLLGAVFALGWTPCLGPTLAAIISISAGTEGMTAVRGIVLIVAYCLGLGLPFLVVALGSARAMRGVGWLRKHSRAIQIAGGVALILVGIALVSGQWAHFITWVRQWTVDYGTTLI